MRFTTSMHPIKTTALLAVSGALLLAAPVQAASSLTVRGRGFGHGIGMSQYGAQGFAKHGIGYEDILKHYYTGTSLKPLTSSPIVRVLLQSTRTVRFTAAATAGAKTLSTSQTYTATTSGGKVTVRSSSGKVVTKGASPLVVSPASGAPIKLKGRAIQGLSNGRYRGTLELRGSGSTLKAINAVGLEPYVRGVISAESPSSWDPDALRAQAIAARTYAITTSAGTKQGFNQYPDTRSQMYRGVAAEKPSTDAAAAATSGRVVTLNGKPVTTFFFSTSGGYTEDVQNSFTSSKPLNWLRGVSDPFDDIAPRHKWTLKFTKSRLRVKLRAFLKGGTFKKITVTKRGVSPRVVKASVVSSRGATAVSGAQLRAALGLYDTWASFNGPDIPPKGGEATPAAASVDSSTGGVGS
jgi:stage II sporulation protein D